MAKAGEQQGPPPQLTELESLQLKCNEVRMDFEGSRDTVVPNLTISFPLSKVEKFWTIEICMEEESRVLSESEIMSVSNQF